MHSEQCLSFIPSFPVIFLNTIGLWHKYLPVAPIVTFKSDLVHWLWINSRMTVNGVLSQIQMFNALIFAYVINTLTDFFFAIIRLGHLNM